MSHSWAGSGFLPGPGYYATVAGGKSNEANGRYATVAGGSDNLAGHDMSPTIGYPTVGGGYANEARGNHATIAGGQENNASGDTTAIGGGGNNSAQGNYSAIPGGRDNQADGAYSFAAGRRANTLHDGSFVWADSLDRSFYSAAVNGFRARTTGGAQFITAVDPFGNPTAGVYVASGDSAWQTYSDRNLKENIEPVESTEVLERLADLPIATWNYRAQDPSIRHMGPMAQDFHAAFGLGNSDKTISTIDPDGVALSAIQGLYRIVKQKETRIAAQENTIAEQQREIATLKERLAAIEAQLAGR